MFRLDLVLQRDDAADEDDGLSLQGQQLEFSRTDDEILDGLSKLVDRLVSSFQEFPRPEFCKITEITQRAFEAEWADVAKSKRAAKAQRRASFSNQ